MTNTEKVCEKNCPDFNGMSILHIEQCQCSCHPVLAKGEIPMTNTEKKIRDEWEDRVHGGHFEDGSLKYVDKLYNFAPTSEVADDIADWWIEKLHQALAEERVRVRIVEEINNTPIDKAHTYSSENSDEYRAFDNGQESYKQTSPLPRQINRQRIVIHTPHLTFVRSFAILKL